MAVEMIRILLIAILGCVILVGLRVFAWKMFFKSTEKWDREDEEEK